MYTPDALLVVTNPERPVPASLVDELHNWSKERGWDFLLVDGDCIQAVPGNAPLGLSLGGDGTLLRSVRLLTPHKVPLLGVNLGSLGFLSPLSVGELWGALASIADGQFGLETRMQLQGVCQGKTHTVLNEFSLSHANELGFTEIELYRGDEFIASYPGDGVILSTPTGSTAYSLAAGGPVLSPELHLLLITPLNPHKLGLRPLIVSPDCAVTVRANGPAVLRGDGLWLAELASGAQMEITAAPTETQLVKPLGAADWFTLLEEKLHWQRHSPRKPLGH